MTLRKKINKMSNEELAEYLVGGFGCGFGCYYMTTDGMEFQEFYPKNALEHQVELLESEVGCGEN